MINFRIYINKTGWEYITTITKIERAFGILDNQISNGTKEFLVIEHDTKLDMDTPIISNTNYEKQKTKRLGQKS
jgi:hypothetical protein